jgi:hypothetical protein
LFLAFSIEASNFQPTQGILMKDIKGKAIFVAEVAVALILINLFQTNVMQIPVVGAMLPGGKAGA